MNPTLAPASVGAVVDRLREANAAVSRRYPGDRTGRQPVHTVYGGAQLFRADTGPRLGAVARRALDEYAPDADALATALELDATLAGTVYERVRAKLAREPVEDFRIDFEDGYGHRPDAEEDGHAVEAGQQVAQGLAESTLPPSIGIRIKPFSEELKARSIRTLDLFLTSLARATGGALPSGLVITLPKITTAHQVTALADLFDLLERGLGLPDGSLALELMIETPQSLVDEHGASALPRLVDAARGRIVAAHFGTYDYTASLGITAAHQHMLHPACDVARQLMQVALAGTGIWLSDGATNIMPIPPHRATGEVPLSSVQRAQNRAVVHRAWRLHYEHVRHSLVAGYYQGWDLHPAQFPTRYAAVYAFFLEGMDAASERLRNFIGKAAQATLVGEVFDDAATGQGLLNYFLRAINCGAIDEDEAVRRSGLTVAELQTRSFARILDMRR